jgi:hypothetical protein
MVWEVVRRDEIWFIEKTEGKASQLFSLSDFDKNKVRASSPFDIMYLNDAFGAIPRFDRNNLPKIY